MQTKQKISENPTPKVRAPRNRTLTILPDEASALLGETLILNSSVSADDIAGKIIHQDLFDCIEHLPDAFIDHLVAEFQDRVADDGSGEPAAWRYARLALESADEASSDHGKALLAACVVERSVSTKWAQWVRDDRALDGSDTNKLLARLAADGLWLSEVLGIYELSAAEREALSISIKKLTQGS